ncbi:MAG: EMC3/TMCO1 family protein [Promethearchaeota archaeon]
MTSEDIILQLFFVAIGMTIFSLLLNKILGLKPERMKLFRQKLLNLQDRMKQAQILEDPQLMHSLQFEMMQLSKEMLKKQVLPMCIRCFIFIGILIFLNFIYADYVTGLLPFPILFFGDGWFAVYFLFALAIGFTIFGIKQLYYKITGKESKRKRMAREMMAMQMPGKNRELGGIIQLPEGINNLEQNPNNLENQKPNVESSDSWKDKIRDNNE